MVKSNTFITKQKVKKNPQDVDEHVSWPAIKGRLQEDDSALENLKNRMFALEFKKKTKKKHVQEESLELWNKALWTDETKMKLSQNDGKGKVWRGKKQLMTQSTILSVRHGGDSLL